MSEQTPRAAALRCMADFAKSQGFELGDIEERDKDTHVEFVSKTPMGREFGIGYQKNSEPTAP